ncbi:MAG: hypothetical protein XU12_C0021G0016 [Deltaproteobacteria bacterium CSP1-8]|nr:MAG: hypothetical protein XU12_C0021G0016 [Deltaproteobacteria bacterium CSP1-8]
MSLSVLLGELGDLLRQGKDRIGKIRGLGEAERFRNAELFLLLDRMDGQLGEFEKKLTSAFGSGLADYEAVKFLNNMLQLEYRGIIDYNLYASAFADRDIREKFRKFGAVEIEHARMIIALIRKMGGTPHPGSGSVRRQRKVTIKELSEEHLAVETEAIALCERGMNTFSRPDLKWALGTIRLDEIEHSRELSKIYEKYKLTTEQVGINRKYVPPKEIDFDGDEPWTG